MLYVYCLMALGVQFAKLPEPVVQKKSIYIR